ncbi:CLUMA_CG020712, isoform A, partial [Clunio marinus]
SKVTKVCSSSEEKKCYIRSKINFQKEIEETCQCLDPCDGVSYKGEKKRIVFAGKLVNRFEKDTITKRSFDVRFKDEKFYPLILTKSYDNIELISHIGGLILLFVGFSFPSIVFATVRYGIKCLIFKYDSMIATRIVKRSLKVLMAIPCVLGSFYIIIKFSFHDMANDIIIEQGDDISVSQIAFPAVTYFARQPWNYKFKGYSKFCVNSELSSFDLFKTSWFQNQTAVWNEAHQVEFAEVMTSRGTGISFNILDFNDMFKTIEISSDFFYDRNITLRGGTKKFISDRPWKAFISSHGSLNLELTTMEIYSRKLEHAFFVHSPLELPLGLVDDDIIEFDEGKSLKILISPYMITTDDDVKRLKIEDRKCFLENEKNLKLFKVYTKRNCELECMSDHTNKTLGCVMLDVVRDRNTEVCDEKHKIEGYKKVQVYTVQNLNCNCLEPCDMIRYDTQILEDKLRNLTTNETFLSFQFKHSTFTPLKRTLRHKRMDMFNFACGLLSFYCGLNLIQFLNVFLKFPQQMFRKICLRK